MKTSLFLGPTSHNCVPELNSNVCKIIPTSHYLSNNGSFLRWLGERMLLLQECYVFQRKDIGPEY